MITWSASNNSSFLNVTRKSKTMIGAVRAARNYIENEIGGEGTLTIYSNGVPIRRDTKDMFTNFKWTIDTDLF